MTPLVTRLHILEELTDSEPLVDQMRFSPHYVITPSLMAILGRGDIGASVVACIEADIARLPYPRMTIEHQVTDKRSWFTLLEDTAGGITGRMACCSKDEAVISPETAQVRFQDGKLHVIDVKAEQFHQCATMAVCCALVLLNMRSLDKQMIAPTAFNDKRAKSGKTQAPHHSVLRIATVYDKSGNGQAFNAATHRMIHMRAGHTRNQPHGPENSLRKLIYIEPIMVNYDPAKPFKPIMVKE